MQHSDTTQQRTDQSRAHPQVHDGGPDDIAAVAETDVAAPATARLRSREQSRTHPHFQRTCRRWPATAKQRATEREQRQAPKCFWVFLFFSKAHQTETGNSRSASGAEAPNAGVRDMALDMARSGRQTQPGAALCVQDKDAHSPSRTQLARNGSYYRKPESLPGVCVQGAAASSKDGRKDGRECERGGRASR